MTAKTEVKAARGAGGNIEVEIMEVAGGIAGAEGAEEAEGSLTANVEVDVKRAAVGTELEAEAGLTGNTDIVLRAKDPKVRHAQVCKMVAGLVLQGTQVTNADPWMCDKEVLHACRQLAVIMKDVEESLDDVRDDFEGMRMKTEVAVEATTLGIKPSQA